MWLILSRKVYNPTIITLWCKQSKLWFFSQSYSFPVVMYGCESWTVKKSWAPKNWCLQTVVLENTLESPLDSNKMKPVNPKGNQSWIFTGRTDAEVPILWPPDEEPTHWKRPWCRKRLRERGEGGNRGWDGLMASLTQWTWIWAKSGRQWRTGKPGMFSPWGCKESDMT